MDKKDKNSISYKTLHLNDYNAIKPLYMKLEFKKHSNLFLVVRKVQLKRNDQDYLYVIRLKGYLICQKKYINKREKGKIE